MDFLINYWYILLVAIALLTVAIYTTLTFLKRPTTEQLKKLEEWLLYAVTEAEKELGGGTGKIKLRYVYDKFLTKFPFLATVVSFESFSLLVDEVLEKFRILLQENESVRNYVNKK